MNLNIIGMELLYKELTDKILAAAYQVHRELGCGFLEKGLPGGSGCGSI